MFLVKRTSYVEPDSSDEYPYVEVLGCYSISAEAIKHAEFDIEYQQTLLPPYLHDAEIEEDKDAEIFPTNVRIMEDAPGHDNVTVEVEG
jgi:hypothetical protein